MNQTSTHHHLGVAPKSVLHTLGLAFRVQHRKWILRAIVPLALALLLPLTLSSRPAFAGASFTVTSTSDAVDANPGNGICETAPGNGICTLRAAIQEANALSGPSTILIPSGTYVLSIAGQNEDLASTGDLDIRQDMTITGAGANVTVIDGGMIDRVFHIRWWPGGGWFASNVQISGVTIRNGHVASLERGGGIHNSGTTLTISEIVISGNSASGSNNYGGGIFSDSVLIILRSAITANSVSGSYASGGGIAGGGTITIENSTVSYNRAESGDFFGGQGGGISFANGSLAINQSTFSGNTALRLGGGQGGGIEVRSGELTVFQSTVSGNAATGGAGIYLWRNTGIVATIANSTISGNGNVNTGVGGGIGGGGNLTIDNSTISNNQARYWGGGIEHGSDPERLLITNSTFAGNSADQASSIKANGGLYVSIGNTLLSSHRVNNCDFGYYPPTSLGYNLSNDATCRLTAAGDQTVDPHTDLHLGPLQDNGGSTLTHALLPGSPALNAGAPTACPAIDQRGVLRPQGQQCDIGAFEAELFDTPPLVDAGGPYLVGEGDTTSVTASGSDPEGTPLTYSWDLDNNGSFETPGQSTAFSAAGLDGPSSHTVAVQVIDSGGLSATDQVTVNVLNVSPTVNAPSVTPGPSTEGDVVIANATFTDPAPNDAAFTCTVNYGDGSGDLPSIVTGNTCTGPSHPYASFGLYTVTVHVTDKDNDTGINFVAHSVIYDFNGFFQPVDNIPTLNMVNAGRAIPVKFSLSGDKGLSIFASGFPKSEVIACDSTALVDGIEETVTAGSSSLSYDPSADQYIYIWKSDKAWAGTCRQLVVKLNDGSYHRANFKFK